MGKAAFDTKRGNIFFFDPEDLVIVEEKSDPLYDQRAAAKVNLRLVRNIMYQRQGVLQPVVISKVGDEAIVIDGRQRVKAAREANRLLSEMGEDPLEVPAVLRRGDDLGLFTVMVSANEHRLEDSPLVKAEKLARFLNQGGTAAEAAVVFGVTSGTISNWTRLLELDSEVKKKVERGQISASAAAELHSLPREKQREKATALVESGTATVEGVKAAAKGSGSSVRSVRMRNRAEIEDMLAEVIAPKEAARALRWVLREVDKPW